MFCRVPGMAPRAAIHCECRDSLCNVKVACPAWLLGPPFLANIEIFCVKLGAPHGSSACKLGWPAWLLGPSLIANIMMFYEKLGAQHGSSGRHSLRI